MKKNKILRIYLTKLWKTCRMKSTKHCWNKIDIKNGNTLHVHRSEDSIVKMSILPIDSVKFLSKSQWWFWRSGKTLSKIHM